MYFVLVNHPCFSYFPCQCHISIQIIIEKGKPTHALQIWWDSNIRYTYTTNYCYSNRSIISLTNLTSACLTIHTVCLWCGSMTSNRFAWHDAPLTLTHIHLWHNKYFEKNKAKRFLKKQRGKEDWCVCIINGIRKNIVTIHTRVL